MSRIYVIMWMYNSFFCEFAFTRVSILYYSYFGGTGRDFSSFFFVSVDAYTNSLGPVLESNMRRTACLPILLQPWWSEYLSLFSSPTERCGPTTHHVHGVKKNMWRLRRAKSQLLSIHFFPKATHTRDLLWQVEDNLPGTYSSLFPPLQRHASRANRPDGPSRAQIATRREELTAGAANGGNEDAATFFDSTTLGLELFLSNHDIRRLHF